MNIVRCKKNIVTVMILGLILNFGAGCATKGQTGALTGAGVGALVGGIAAGSGSEGAGALIGAGVGAGASGNPRQRGRGSYCPGSSSHSITNSRTSGGHLACNSEARDKAVEPARPSGDLGSSDRTQASQRTTRRVQLHQSQRIGWAQKEKAPTNRGPANRAQQHSEQASVHHEADGRSNLSPVQ